MHDIEEQQTWRKRRYILKRAIATCIPLLPHLCDGDIACLSGVTEDAVEILRVAFDIDPVRPQQDPPATQAFQDYPGPWLGYESLFGTMSVAKISRFVGVPFRVVEERRLFLGADRHQRISRIVRYEHLLGVVSDEVIAQLAEVSIGRVGQYRRRSMIRTRFRGGSANINLIAVSTDAMDRVE